MTDTQQRAAAKAFAKNWKDRGYEKGDSQIFWVELLTTVFGLQKDGCGKNESECVRRKYQ